VNRRTYEIVGPLARVDERDTVFARAGLEEGSPRERAYHETHPETKDVDLKMREFYEREADPYFESVFGPIASLALPDIVDGPVSTRKVEQSPAYFASLVKRVAVSLGADLVGIAVLNQAWVYSHRGRHPFFEDYVARPPFFTGPPQHYTGFAWGDPIEIEHRYVIAMAFAQRAGRLGEGASEETDFEVGRVYARSALVSVQLARFVRELGYSARAHHVRNYGIMVVPAAVDSALGELGRCGYLVTRKFGANTRIACVTTDLPMETDRALDIGMQDFCGKCRKCAEACPVGAIPAGDKVVVRGVRKWEIDREKCFLYWAKKGHSCAICQAVCPWSRADTLLHTVASGLAIRAPLSRQFLLWVDGLLDSVERRS
jgi:reductive dehalogenase